MFGGASRGRAPVSSAGVRVGSVLSGTSRFAVVPPLSDTGVTLEQMVHALTHAGLFGEHYQTCKLVELVGASPADGVRFLFHQALPEHGVISGLECANGAAAAMLMARAWELTPPDSARALNVGTGQSSWIERQNQGSLLLAFDALQPPLWMVGGGPLEFSGPWGSVDCWIVARGNLFVFLNAHPELAQRDGLDSLREQARAWFLEAGGDPRLAELAKIVCFQVVESAHDAVTVHAACWSGSSEHKSLPGSGAMLLARLLTESLAAAGTPGVPTVFWLQHPSGVLPVQVDFQAWEQTPRVQSMKFETDARVVLDAVLEVEL